MEAEPSRLGGVGGVGRGTPLDREREGGRRRGGLGKEGGDRNNRNRDRETGKHKEK